MDDNTMRARHGDPERQSELGARPKINYAELDESALVEAMREGNSRAIEEFLTRHQRLLFDRARSAGLRRRDCEDAVEEVVEDVAILITARRLRPTKKQGIAGYLVRSFFNRIADEASERKRRSRIACEGSDVVSGEEEPAVLGAISEHTIRASQGPDWEYVPLSAPLAKLASMIEEGLSPEELQLLAWHSKYVPFRQIATWLDVPYATAAQRSWRLRQRLRGTALQYAANFARTEWLEIAAFLDRCAITYEEGPLLNADDSPPRTA